MNIYLKDTGKLLEYFRTCLEREKRKE